MRYQENIAKKLICFRRLSLWAAFVVYDILLERSQPCGEELPQRHDDTEKHNVVNLCVVVPLWFKASICDLEFVICNCDLELLIWNF